MKRIAVAVVLVAAMLFSAGCATKVPPGYVGIKVNNIGSQKGVNDFPAKTGLVWFNPFTENVYKWPTFLQTVVWTKADTEGSPNDDSITFNSMEGAEVNVDIAMSYRLEEAKVPHLFVEFRQDVDHITHGYVRSQVRDAFSRVASTYPVMNILGPDKQNLLNEVKKYLNDELGPRGFYFDMISFVGKPRVDGKVEGSINSVIEATQNANEAEQRIRESAAIAAQKVATARGDSLSAVINAAGIAEANRKIEQSLTNNLIQWKIATTWDGHLPTVTGSGMPLLQIPTSK